MERTVPVSIGERHVRAVLQQMVHEFVGVVSRGDNQRSGAV